MRNYPPPCKLRKSGVMLGWDRIIKVSPSPKRAPLSSLGKRREETEKGQAVLAPDLCGTSPLCPGGKKAAPPAWGAVGEPGESSGKGAAPARDMGGRRAPANHCVQSLLSGRNSSGTIYFPIVTALADDASVAGPKPCAGAHFLIRKRI